MQVQSVPQDNAPNLPQLVRFCRPVIPRLKIQDFDDSWPREDSMASSNPAQGKSQRPQKADEVIEWNALFGGGVENSL